MNRSDLQALTEIRIAEAKALLDARMPEGAYYLAGYAVECAVKACIAKLTKEHDFPDKELASQIYTHKIKQLVKAAGLEPEWKKEIKANKEFRDNWQVVKDWSEEVRYSSRVSPKLALDLYNAITDSKAGVLEWLKKWW
jgi:HEPN domain-containing protein